MLKSWKTEGGHRRILQSSVAELMESRRAAAAQAQAPYTMPVLIVEDDPHLVELYEDHMSQWPFPVTVYVAPNGYEALILAGEVQPKLLVCDLRLPGVNGFNIVRGLCQVERFKDMGIVVVSGLPLAEINAHGGLPERVTVMAKPVAYDKLQTLAEGLWKADSGISTLI